MMGCAPTQHTVITPRYKTPVTGACPVRFKNYSLTGRLKNSPKRSYKITRKRRGKTNTLRVKAFENQVTAQTCEGLGSHFT